jgi:peptide/nickel transport system permease protein
MAMHVDLPDAAVSLPPVTGQTAAAPRVVRRVVPVSLQAILANRKATVGALILIGFILVAALAPVISPGDPTDFVARPHLPPSREHWFGTTGQGQDVFDQTVWGTRVSFTIGLAVGVLTTLVGIVVGMTAGYFRGRVDDVLSLVMNVFLIIPTLPLLVVLSAFTSSGSSIYFVAVLTLTGWAWGARVIRSQTLSLREKDFVAAAKVSGEGSIRIIFREMLPNMLSIIVAGMLGATIFAIGALAGLEFIGLGNSSVVTWGTNLYWAANNAGLITGAWWTIVPSGLCIALVAFGLALMNYAIDEITNPRLRAQREIGNALAKSKLRGKRSRSTPVLRNPA